MRAAWYEHFGPASDVLRIGERDAPEPGHGEVVVRLHTSGVNPSDVKKRAGSQPEILGFGYVIPHSDGAGVIESVGNGVPVARVGERVWVYQAQHKRRFGTAAQYVALPAARAVRMPDDTGFDVGACLGIPAMTAHRCVFGDGPVKGQVVVVTGGAGRVGHYAIQWAKWGGATVIGTAGTEAGRAQCLDAGADAAFDYRNPKLAEMILDYTNGTGAHRIVDVEFGINLENNLDLLRTSGVIATYASMGVPTPKLPFYRMMFLDLTVRMTLVYEMPEEAKAEAAADITALLEAGGLTHRIVHTLPLAEIAEAHRLIELGGVSGCVVVHTG